MSDKTFGFDLSDDTAGHGLVVRRPASLLASLEVGNIVAGSFLEAGNISAGSFLEAGNVSLSAGLEKNFSLGAVIEKNVSLGDLF